MRARKGCYFATEIVARPVDAFTKRIASEAGDLDRRPHFALGFLHCLRHALFVVENKALIEQADLLVEGLEPRLDDLLDDVCRLALGFELLGENIFLALNGRRVQS